MRIKFMPGMKYGKITLISTDSERSTKKHRFYFVKTDCCGKVLSRGPSDFNIECKSCAFLGDKNPSHVHGMQYSPENEAWNDAKGRCYNPKNKSYKDYGGRGIVMCDRWRQRFIYFYEDMGPRPTPLHSIDRIDNNGNYEPSNCRWATRLEQNNNTRRNVFFEYNGIKKTLPQWHREFRPEISKQTFIERAQKYGVEWAISSKKGERVQ